MLAENANDILEKAEELSEGARPQGDGGRAVRRNRNFGRKNSGRSQNHRRSY